MTEYIEREAACSKMPDDIYGFRDKKIIRSIPAADVRRAMKGHWIGIDEFPHEDWECDCCGEQVCGDARIPQEMNFCPNCGADMRSTDG